MSDAGRDLWREDAKLGQTVSNAKEQLQINERALHGMMDKVSIDGDFPKRNFS